MITINIIRTKNWLIVTGQVLLSEIVKDDNFEIVESKTTAYSYKIKYEYEINGKIYYGNKISYVKFTTTNKEYIDELLNKYRIGTKVSVYYNPKKITDCLLEINVNTITIIFIISLLLIIIVSIILLLKKYNII
jgi:hypothetical protein